MAGPLRKRSACGQNCQNLGVKPGKDKGGMTCYIGPCTLYDLVNHPRIKILSVKLQQWDILQELERMPPVCLFRRADHRVVELLQRRRFPVRVDETAVFQPKRGDWAFVVSYSQGSERDGRLEAPSVSFQTYLVTEVASGRA